MIGIKLYSWDCYLWVWQQKLILQPRLAGRMYQFSAIQSRKTGKKSSPD